MKDLMLGVIGNTGPEADEVLQKLIRLECVKRGASKDQDFLPMVVVKNPNITDRTLAILNGETSPAVGIVESCKLLKQCNCHFAALPSNTSHYFYDEYQSKTDVYVLDIISLTINHVKSTGAKVVGLLATTPTVQTKLFETRFAEHGIEVVTPDSQSQETFVQSAIYGTLNATGEHEHRLPDGLKTGKAELGLNRVSQAIEKLVADHQLEAFILGCTEISIISRQLSEAHPEVSFIDPMQILATECVQFHSEVLQYARHLAAIIHDGVVNFVRHDQTAGFHGRCFLGDIVSVRG